MYVRALVCGDVTHLFLFVLLLLQQFSKLFHLLISLLHQHLIHLLQVLRLRWTFL